ncbi:DUF6282 family protein [uncultured Cohaesibacter sp.]|uniref:DUF6282 family protein n=1 Tax=uncultured Cohaesibacter sp. TaxID=1002546 RepID=UPI00292D3764|nr:DUF6282 family protein [uncultured Cohaesibacter sp.]
MSTEENRERVRTLIAPIDDARVDALMQGAVDLHVHSGPSIMERQVDHYQAVEQAAAAGMKGILFKDHHYSVSPFIPIMERLLGDVGIAMFGGLVLNNSAGGFNPYIVDSILKHGAKMIWMPTAHSANHIRTNFRKTRLAAKVALKKPTLLTVLDDKGDIIDPVKTILDSIAEFDAILSSGHLNVWEIWKLFEEAKSRGVKRLIVNHPMYGLHFTHDDIREIAQTYNALIEQSACLYIDSRFNVFTPENLVADIRAAGVEHSSIGSDLGQVDNPTPVEGMRQAIKLCLALRFSDAEVRMMVRDNPSRLVGIEVA